MFDLLISVIRWVSLQKCLRALSVFSRAFLNFLVSKAFSFGMSLNCLAGKMIFNTPRSPASVKAALNWFLILWPWTSLPLLSHCTSACSEFQRSYEGRSDRPFQSSTGAWALLSRSCHSSFAFLLPKMCCFSPTDDSDYFDLHLPFSLYPYLSGVSWRRREHHTRLVYHDESGVWFGLLSVGGGHPGRAKAGGAAGRWSSLIHSELLEITVCIYCLCFFPCCHCLNHFWVPSPSPQVNLLLPSFPVTSWLLNLVDTH